LAYDPHPFMSDLVEQLRREYPRLYPSELPSYALDVPEGWAEILRRLSERLKDKPINVRQVNEKFGGLRFHFNGPRDDVDIRSAVIEAEDASWVTCDTCGAPGVLRETDKHWLTVRCTEHGKGALPVDQLRRRGYPVAIAGLDSPKREGVASGFVTPDELQRDDNDEVDSEDHECRAPIAERSPAVFEAGSPARTAEIEREHRRLTGEEGEV
jgi:hypothetical protein